MLSFEDANREYWNHKNVCTQPYDPYTRKQCSECARLIDQVALAMVEEKENEK